MLTVVTTGLAVLLWALVSVGSVGATIEDRVAVRSGASATAELRGSWQLDPQAPTEPTDEAGSVIDDASDLPPGLGTPELAAGQTLVWRTQTFVPGRTGGVDLLLVDPVTFGEVASWGPTGRLDGLRDQLPALADADRQIGAQLRAGGGASALPAVAVGDLGLEVGRRASFSTDVLPVDVTVIDVVEVAPGRTSNRPVLVVPADSFLLQMLTRDPRLKPGREAFSRTQFRTELWVADGSAALDRTLEAADVEPVEVRTADQLRATPELVASSLGSAYQVAIGVVLALLAAGALAFHADRTAAQHRAADVLLARAGLGARGVAAGAAERPPGRHDPGRPVSAPTSHGADALVLRHVTHGQREHGHPVLADVDLHVARGEMVALVGRSGSGKSTVCQLAFGLERPGSGEVLVDGAPPSSGWRRTPCCRAGSRGRPRRRSSSSPCTSSTSVLAQPV